MAALGRVLIVGAGIGGLTLGAALRRRGIAFEVVEQAPEWRPVGAGIGLGVNALSVLRRLGLDAEIEARGVRIGRARIADERGRTIRALDLSRWPIGGQVALHRGALHQVLLAAAGADAVKAGVTVRALEPAANGVAIERSDGHRGLWDLVIGADGIRSSVRTLVFGPVSPRYAGYTCWRFTKPLTAPVDGSIELWGRGRRFGLVAIAPGQLYGYATANAPRGTPDPPEGRLARFRARFASFGGPVPEVLRTLSDDDPLLHGDLEEVVLPRWIRGRVALIGDAAHAMTPNLALGAAMAMEDAWVLAEALTRGPTIKGALAVYEARRRPRVRRVQEASRRIGRVGQWSGVFACALRDAIARATPDAVGRQAFESLVREGVTG